MTTAQTRTALITGASRGLGLALARELARRGWTLILDARHPEDLETARAELSALSQVIAIPGDVSAPAHRHALADAAHQIGGLDALINNASTLGPSPLPHLLDYPPEMLEQVYVTNAVAPLALVQTLRHTLKPGARVINVTSDAGVEAYPGWGGYGASKAALEQLSHVLAAECPEWRVYWVDPGDMRTAMHQQAFPGEDISDRPLPEESVPGFIALLEGDLPGGRYKARDVAATAATPASQRAAPDHQSSVRELRVALTVDNFDCAVRLYRDGFQLPVVKQWDTPEGRGVILASGRGTLEILDRADSQYTDLVEAGRPVSGPVRLALEVSDLARTSASLYDHGARIVGDPVITSWGSPSQRLQAPDGMQLTLFQPPAGDGQAAE